MTKKETSRVPEEKTPSGLTAAIFEMAEALHRNGILDDAAYDRITVRHLGEREAALRLAVRGRA